MNQIPIKENKQPKLSRGWLLLIIDVVIFIIYLSMFSTSSDAAGLAFWGFIIFILLCVFTLSSTILFVVSLIRNSEKRLSDTMGLIGNLLIVAIFLYYVFIGR